MHAMARMWNTENSSPLIMLGAGIKLKIVRLIVCLYPPSHFISPCSFPIVLGVKFMSLSTIPRDN